LDAINNIQSNRIDGVEQFIQSLAIAVNCQFDDGTTANDIRKAGMIVLKSVGENKADFKILSEQLDQQQTQTLVDYIYSQVQRICAMPFVDRQGRSYDSTGAAALVTSGWFQADAAARNTEDLFRKSNHQFDRIIVEILRRKGILDIDLNDFDIELAKNETANIQSKAQAFQTLMAAGFHPELAAKKSGVSNDPVSDIKMSEKYIKMIWGDPDKADAVEQQTDGQGEAQIVERDADNGEDTMGGAV
jgi:SPP1 family phage portal protein